MKILKNITDIIKSELLIINEHKTIKTAPKNDNFKELGVHCNISIKIISKIINYL